MGWQFSIGCSYMLGKLATVIYPLCFRIKNLELLLYLSFKVELPINDLPDISFLVLKYIQTWHEKTVARQWDLSYLFRVKIYTISVTKRQFFIISVQQSNWFRKFSNKNLEFPIKSSRILFVMLWCFGIPKDEPSSSVTSLIQKNKFKIVVISILNVLDHNIPTFALIFFKKNKEPTNFMAPFYRWGSLTQSCRETTRR